MRALRFAACPSSLFATMGCLHATWNRFLTGSLHFLASGHKSLIVGGEVRMSAALLVQWVNRQNLPVPSTIGKTAMPTWLADFRAREDFYCRAMG
jgi:hypothetical protein